MICYLWQLFGAAAEKIMGNCIGVSFSFYFPHPYVDFRQIAWTSRHKIRSITENWIVIGLNTREQIFMAVSAISFLTKNELNANK